MRFDEFVVEYLDKFPDGENPYDYLSTYSTQEIIDLYLKSGKKQMKIVYYVKNIRIYLNQLIVLLITYKIHNKVYYLKSILILF